MYEHAYAMLQNDEKFKQAIKFATITCVVNATKLQKKLKIGCSRAEKYVETMQNLGIMAETSSIHCVPKIEKNKSNTALLRALINNIDVLG